jgi:hypothetical protein
MKVAMLPGRHPALLTDEQLQSQCELRTQRRSGPGGQHRNKTSSGVFLLHVPTAVVAEATERRSQAENREVALVRLRLRLAVEIRTPSILDGPVDDAEQDYRQRGARTSLKIGQRNPARPAVLALILNDLHAVGGKPSAVATIWKTTSSAMVRFIQSYPPAFALLNAIRKHHRLGPLKAVP